ncbi:unnamed protein product [Cylindrotheca closterium]|uniref:Calcineurin-like phosphoesterase domain-containing protein n=1 Tax=Cylindrotheca closterium TaxID=2856 RepID=A0AAD2JM02_9STRA|nr:unnamed protein product [Cylindrotheca closterium]
MMQNKDSTEDKSITKNPIFGEELRASGEGNLSPTGPSSPVQPHNNADSPGDSTKVTPSEATAHVTLSNFKETDDARMGWKAYVKFSILVLILLSIVAVGYILAMPYLKPDANTKPALSINNGAGEGVSTTTATTTTTAPSLYPTITPSANPSLPISPSDRPSDLPSTRPTARPTNLASNNPTIATQSPTLTSSFSPTSSPTFDNTTTIFYAIGDVPYRSVEKVELAQRMRELPQDGDFLIHVGDFRSAADPTIRCSFKDYLDVRRILLESKIPVFIVPGDNEWNDCPNPIQGMSYWVEAFSSFERNWKHSLQVERHSIWPENFFFSHKSCLYFGLNLVGGAIHISDSNKTEYSTQLRMQFEWVKSKIDQHIVDVSTSSTSANSRIVIFGHAFPVSTHDAFFDPLQQYVRETLLDQVPILYLNGDNHYYEFEPNYRGLKSVQRLQVDWGTTNPPLKVMLSPPMMTMAGSKNILNDTFSHDRMLGA